VTTELDTIVEEAPIVFPQPKSLRRPHQIAGIVLLALGLLVVWQALSLRYYTSLGPGPGFFSFWLGVILSILAVAMIAIANWRKPEALVQPIFTDIKGYIGIAAICGALLFAGQFIRPLGYPLTMLVILLTVFRTGGTSWRATIIGSLIGSFGLYYIFVNLLRVQLPGGFLGF
jgi:putative tricarboxylic transport membrane protein